MVCRLMVCRKSGVYRYGARPAEAGADKVIVARSLPAVHTERTGEGGARSLLEVLRWPIDSANGQASKGGPLFCSLVLKLLCRRPCGIEAGVPSEPLRSVLRTKV